MSSTLKEIGLFTILFLLFFGLQYIHTRPEWKFELIMSIVLLAGIIGYYYGVKVCSGESFHFEVTPEKQCDGGPYMYSSAPDHVKNYCNKLLSSQEGIDQYNKYNCNGAYVGRPLNFPDFAPPSNDMWENEMCKQQSFNGPAVL
jgi:hypothetical protein